MKLLFVPLQQLFSKIIYAKGKNGLILQRLFWGTLIGYFSTLLLTGSPYLENIESHMLEWRYKLASENIWHNDQHLENWAKDVSLVKFDDRSQFELGIARFNDLPAQEILANSIEQIEKFSPRMIVLDIDLRGAHSIALANVFKRYHNIVLALFGNLEGNSSLPSPDYLTNAAAFGYDELTSEASGKVRQLPISYRASSLDSFISQSSDIAPVPSLTEAVLNLNCAMEKSNPDIGHKAHKGSGKLYSSFREKQYRSVSFIETLGQIINIDLFKDKIVIFGETLTPRQQEIENRTSFLPKLYLQANAISTLLEDEQNYTFSPQLAKLLILMLGTFFGSLAAVLKFIPRSCLFLLLITCLLLASQISFQNFHMVVPTASPLAAIFVSYLIGTFIYLNTDLKLRNEELAKARESMQIRAEDERQRIAEDLHDETLPNLAAIARMADQLSKELVTNPVPGQMRDRLDFTVSEMRRVINDLHPSVLETMGFKPAIENLLAILRRDNNIQCKFIDSDNMSEDALPKLWKLQLYRIVQECLNNTVKHSQATNVEILMSIKENKVLLSVVDNGIGMSKVAFNKESHGIINIKQRAHMIGTKVSWTKPSNYPSGTEVRIELPLNLARGEGVSS